MLSVSMAYQAKHRSKFGWVVAAVWTIGALMLSAPGVRAATTYSTDKGSVLCNQAVGHTDCLGIPYAAPPTGARRLRAPADVQPWGGTLSALAFRPACLQPKTEYGPAQGSEDCLYLNVYVPTNTTPTTPRPVIVWLHGGGFVAGSGNAFNGSNLAQTANAIIVTVNYRLGPLGWLALPSLAAEAPDKSTGNYGLFDSIAALKWVQRNIASFGGDRNRVTVMGQSAGGEQVFILLAAPQAKGLFHRAISMSSPATLSMPTIEEAAAGRTDFLGRLGCTNAATQPACLRNVTAQQMIDAAQLSWDLIGNGGLQYTPTVDGVVLKDQWLSVYKTGNFNKVPTMIGHTKEEARLMLAIFENKLGRPVSPTDATMGLGILGLGGSTGGGTSVPLPAGYNVPSSGLTGDIVARVGTDVAWALGETENRDELSKSVPVYGYRSCDLNAPESHVHAKFSRLGCAHDSDLPYLFQWDDFTGVRPAFTTEQQNLAVQMGRYWGNFAATGNPNGTGLPNWPRHYPLSSQVQLLEPASQGGVRPSLPGAYLVEHNVPAWQAIFLARDLLAR